MLYGHHFLWSDSENVYIAKRTLSHQWRPSSRCELSLSLMMVVCTPLKHVGVKVNLKGFVSHILNLCITVGTYLVNNSIKCMVSTT
jgi:hypothetical protein